MNVYDSKGAPLHLGPRLGSGGEGAVYEINGDPARVAKLYHKPPPDFRQQKLRAMVSTAQADLLRVAAWPVDTLHTTRGGAVAGIVMPRVSGYGEIHLLYSPKHRQSEFPRADWGHLVQAARNTAAAVEMVHEHGHVIGDVNQKNFTVAPNATVMLVDCDGFQIALNGSIYPCEVGVAHFTPPELQGKSFRGIQRTKNHDAFGLAVLCFHLLFMGRHPFAGRFLGSGDMPIERAIAEHRFSFGASARAKLMEPPPGALSLNALPANVAALFERAFGSVTDGRPTATQWREALEQMGRQLRTCTRVAAHKFHAIATTCTWCELEGRAGVIFFLGPLAKTTAAMFDVAAAWTAIERVAAPRSLGAMPRPPITGIIARPLPMGLKSRRRAAAAARVLLSIATIAFPLLVSTNPYVVAALLAIAVIVLFLPLPGRDEAIQRAAALEAATDRWNELGKRWSHENTSNVFAAELGRLRQKRDDHRALQQQYARERGALEAAKRAKQLEHFLDRFYIDQVKIAKIGPGRKATLASFGIETAADVSYARLSAVPGFGPALVASLMAWRASLEQRFTFNPNQAVDPQDIARLDAQFAPRRRDLEHALRLGPSVLESLRNQIEVRHAQLRTELDARARDWAQARADHDAMNILRRM